VVTWQKTIAIKAQSQNTQRGRLKSLSIEGLPQAQIIQTDPTGIIMENEEGVKGPQNIYDQGAHRETREGNVINPTPTCGGKNYQ